MNHFVFDYNSRISWSILLILAPIETGMLDDVTDNCDTSQVQSINQLSINWFICMTVTLVYILKLTTLSLKVHF